MSIKELTEISRYYGKNPDYVLAGGGNTSWKDENTLYIKGSGMSLAEVTKDSFVKMNRKALGRIWEKRYPASSAERESAVLADMMAARNEGEEKRPSVETLLHGVMPFGFVVHLHPALVNGLTCSRQGEKAAKEIFGDSSLWIPTTTPGYILSEKVKNSMDEYRGKHGKPPAIILLQNHGVFAGAGSIDEIKKLYDSIMLKIDARVQRRPDFSNEKRTAPSSPEIIRTLTDLAGAAAFIQSREISALVKDRASFAPLSSAFTPDHIVYAGSEALFVEAGSAAALKKAWKSYAQQTGRNPKITAVRSLGVFGTGTTEKAALLARDLFKDAVKIAVYSESFGGYKFLPKKQIDFINGWEVERFRASILTK